MTDTDITRQEWDHMSADAWRDRLSDQWSRPMVDLSPSVYWVALRGALYEPADDMLERAAMDMMAAARDGVLTIYGYRHSPSPDRMLASIAPEAFLKAGRFIPEIADIDALNNGEPHLLLNFVLEPNGRDKIARHFDEILVDRLCVRRDDLMRRWPAGRTPLREMALQIIESKGVIGQKSAWEIVRASGTNCSRDEFTEVWKSLAGVQKTGPKGPRKIVPETPDNSGQLDN